MSEPMERIAEAYLKEQRRTRRWRIFFKLCWLIIIIVIISLLYRAFSTTTPVAKPHIALIKLEGVIADDAPANAHRINKSLAAAFKDKDTKAVVLQINSPGGSPVQSDDIYQQIRYLEKKYPKIPLYAICSDVCASGGYYVASAAKEIYANPMTITGSIGVRAGGFGFVELLKKIGVERRLYTAGKDKGFLDPFEPQNAYQVDEMEKLLTETHQVFINAVKQGRGDRLKLRDEDSIFSGMPFSGIQAKKYGLIDAFGSLDTLRHTKLKDLPVVNYTVPLSLIDKLSKKLGTEVSYQAASLSNLKLN
ncbi:S49 family peptidase [Fangia hongkongensis]|uniref:S49 family peptidase n=1 Tax=Fangia hongkongensis TaxID=270495 RepID=UPI00037FE0A3|nr:S49 family peptidase [Fangia hongkongensis]MBK2124192.1 S49 family peptidase [Fangia hongkongensis]